jgi:4-aminobutyrate aminotransferase-like enzyme/Ser/Thr protein kinase RdoA (MazF antagonist)
MNLDFQTINISTEQAKQIAKELFNIEGKISALDGEIDFNFKLKTKKEIFLLKISRPEADKNYIEFQQKILTHVDNSTENIQSPKVLPDLNGNYISEIKDDSGNTRLVRLLSWINGRLWSEVNPQRNDLLFSLGNQVGMLTKVLQNFDHPFAHRKFEWDIAQAEWTFDFIHLFDEKQQKIAKYFQNRFKEIKPSFERLRKSVIHNDANDNNVVVSNDFISPKAEAIIDYGDTIYTQSINDLAVTIAYAVMNKADVLEAAIPIVKGYNSSFTLQEEELEVLFTLVAMRLIISVSKSAINKQKEPDNKYLLVSEKPAWEVLEKWMAVNENLAHYSFREACGFNAHPNEKRFEIWAKDQTISINNFFPDQELKAVKPLDMGIESRWLGHESEYSDNNIFEFKIKQLNQQNPNTLFAGGYLETRPFYSTDAYKKESNSGPKYRSVHLGIDFWLKANTSIYSIFDGKVFSLLNNDNDKDYGPTLILEHQTNNGVTFYSLYGHLSKSSLQISGKDQFIKKGDLLGFAGNASENGNWCPHLHFQLMLDMLGNKKDFPGVAFPDETEVWKSICPNPNIFFDENELEQKTLKEDSDVINFRKQHLGKSLSLSYDKPLKMLRGMGAFLMDSSGRKYLDTVNNVAHVGHEHPAVVKAAQQQMGILNTNSRYLHENINDFAEALLSTFPKELSVVHFVNSGSEANELALRMCKAWSGQKDMIAVEIGYHGNTNGCIDISSYKFDGKGGKGAPEHTHIVPLPDSFRGMYQGANCGLKYASHIQEQLEIIQSKGRNVAGFICESIISCGGQIELPKDYLKIAYDLVHKAGGLCISDEVQVGCGRMGSEFWGFQLHNVIPDIVTIGKPIGNGHPLAAVVCTREVADAFANGMEYFNTFGGNPVSCAIGKAVFDTIKKEKLQENALVVGNYLKEKLSHLQSEFPIIADVRGQGLFLGFELNDAEKHPLTEKATYLANRMKNFGILMSTDGKDNNVLKIKPPIVFSKENADELLKRLKTVFKEDFMMA